VSGREGVPGPAVAAAMLVVLVVAFTAAGGYAASEVPSYASSPREILGMALMLTLMPPYVVLGAWVSQRRSLGLVEQTRPLLDDPTACDAAAETLRTALRRNWIPFSALGFAMAMANTQPLDAVRSNVPALALTISLGQVGLWMVIGLMLGVRFGAARAFRRLASIVPVDLLRPDRLKPIARAGLVDVVLIMGGMLIAPLQSIDAEFRWYNYRFALMVMVPVSAFALIWPLVPLHRRNRAERDARLAELDRQIGAHGEAFATSPDASVRLEALLAHRDRLRGVRTWPLSGGLLTRLVLYLVIPPLAWAGAAVVELFVDRLLGS